jgi:polyphosphate kinase 2
MAKKKSSENGRNGKDKSAGSSRMTMIDDRPPLSKKEKKQALYDLQVEMVKLQDWVKETGAKICVVFEGRDTAGKGGTIKRMTARVSPRVFRVVALPAPTERQKSQMYVQRYIEHFPAAGEVVIFDRSWYNRAGVERVMGFASEDEVETFFKHVVDVERAMIASNIILVKYWLETSMEHQWQSLDARIRDGRKTWKLSPMDLESRRRWYDYSRARDEMLRRTDTDDSPWHVIPVTDGSRKGLNCISHFLSVIPYTTIEKPKVKLPEPNPPGDYEEPDYPYRFVPDRY